MSKLILISILIIMSMGCFSKDQKNQLNEVPGQDVTNLTLEELKEKAIVIADSLMISFGYDLQQHDRKVALYEKYIEIEYLHHRLRKKTARGGGTIFKISRATLRVEEIVGEQ